MHLVFLNSEEPSGGFNVHKKGETLEFREEVLEYFLKDKKYKVLMDEYFSIKNEAELIALRRKEVLQELKDGFKLISPKFEEEHPEYFI